MSVDGNKLSPNPFERRLKLTFLNKLQIAFMSVTIFPIRLLLAISCVLLACFVCFIATVTLPNVAKKPLTGWRRKLKFIVKGFLRGMFFFTGIHRIKVRGKENMENGQEPDIVIAGPHTTFYDTSVMYAFNEMPTGISRIENIELLVLGSITKYFMPISVVRDDPDSRKKTIDEIKTRLKCRKNYRQNLERGKARDDDPDAMNWPTLYSFPEGTVGNGKYLMNFKYGAFIPGHPVQPVYIRHYNAMNTTTWPWIGPSALKVVWLTLCQFRTTTVISILPLYNPSADEKEDPKLFANNVRALIAKNLEISTVDMDFNDADIFIYLSLLSLQPLNVMVFLNRALKKIQFKEFFRVAGFTEKNFLIPSKDYSESWKNNPLMNLTQFKKYLGQLEYVGQEIDQDGGVDGVGGGIDGGGVEKWQSLAEKLEVEEVFVACLEEEESKVDIRKFLIWLCLCSYPRETEYLVRLAFKLYNRTPHKNAINEEDMAKILVVLFQCSKTEVHNILKELYSFSSEITYGYFRACSVTKSSGSFGKYQRFMNRFFMPKNQLIRMTLAEERVVGSE